MRRLALALAVPFTVVSMATPAAADHPWLTSTGNPFHWGHTTQPRCISLSDSLTSATYDDGARKGAAEWSKAAKVDADVHPAGTSGVEIPMTEVDTNETWAGLATISSAYSNGHMLDASIKVQRRYAGNASTAAAIVTHEQGHLVGALAHSNEAPDVSVMVASGAKTTLPSAHDLAQVDKQNSHNDSSSTLKAGPSGACSTTDDGGSTTEPTASTLILRPNGTVSGGWTEVPSGYAHDRLNDAVTYPNLPSNTDDYTEDRGTGTYQIVHVQDVPSGRTAQKVRAWVHLDGAQGDSTTIEIKNGSTIVAKKTFTGPFDGTQSSAWKSVDYTASLSTSALNNLRIAIVATDADQSYQYAQATYLEVDPATTAAYSPGPVEKKVHGSVVDYKQNLGNGSERQVHVHYPTAEAAKKAPKGLPDAVTKFTPQGEKVLPKPARKK